MAARTLPLARLASLVALLARLRRRRLAGRRCRSIATR